MCRIVWGGRWRIFGSVVGSVGIGQQEDSDVSDVSDAQEHEQEQGQAQGQAHGASGAFRAQPKKASWNRPMPLSSFRLAFGRTG